MAGALASAERVLEMTVGYAKARQAFDKAIGSFQAVRHKCADMVSELEAARSVTYYAAATLAQQPDQAPHAGAQLPPQIHLRWPQWKYRNNVPSLP